MSMSGSSSSGRFRPKRRQKASKKDKKHDTDDDGAEYENELDLEDQSSPSDNSWDNDFETPKKRRYTRMLYQTKKYRRPKQTPLLTKSPASAGSRKRTYESVDNSTESESSHQELLSFGETDQEQQISSVSEDTISESDPVLNEESENSMNLSEELSSNTLSDDIHNISNPDDGSDSENEEIPKKDLPLYEGSSHTQFSSAVMIMLFVLKHSLTNDAFNDLLKVIETHLPAKSNFTTSVYKLKDFMKGIIGFREPQRHYACDICGKLLTHDQKCDRPNCNKHNAKIVEFQELSLEDQIKELFKDEKFYTSVSLRRVPMKPITDIHDGDEYQRLISGLPTVSSNTIDLTVTMNTDGVTLFSSSKKGNLWPVYLAVNELPPRLRFSKKYIIPTLIYCHSDKPNMMTYLSPLQKTLEKLHTDGMEVCTPNGTIINVRIHLLAASVDLPARSLVMNMKQYNGKFGCSICLDEGKTPQNQPLLRYYPYTDGCQIRTHQSMIDDAKAAIESKTAVHGVLGACPFMLLDYVDLPKLFVVDWMHCVLLGVVKTLLGLWLAPAYKGQQFYIGDKMVLLNNRLLNIKVPDYIARRQRSIDDYTHWKATECREWLMHYSVPVLNGVLKWNVFSHYSLLVTAMYLLNQETISTESIDVAEAQIEDFCSLFPRIYVEKKQTINIHMLRHLPQCVRTRGPLFCYSCFGFESMNCHIKSMVHGARHVNKQICFAVGMIKYLPDLIKRIHNTMDERVKDLLPSLWDTIVSDNNERSQYHSLGSIHLYQLQNWEKDTLPDIAEDQLIGKFYRLQTPNCGILFSSDYQRMSKRNSSTIAFNMTNDEGNLQFGDVLYFLEANNSCYAVVSQFLVDSNCIIPFDAVTLPTLVKYKETKLCPHIFRVKDMKWKKLIIPVTNITKKCVLMEVDSVRNYVSFPPNLLEHS